MRSTTYLPLPSTIETRNELSLLPPSTECLDEVFRRVLKEVDGVLDEVLDEEGRGIEEKRSVRVCMKRWATGGHAFLSLKR